MTWRVSMRRIIYLFAILAAMAGTSLAAEPLEYKPYASTDGRYKTLFPGAVKTETKDIAAGGKTLTLTLDSVEVADGILFLVTYIDAPDDVAKLPASMRLDKLRDGNKGEDGKLL